MDYILSLFQTSPVLIDGQPFVTAEPILLGIAFVFVILAVVALAMGGGKKK